VRIGMKHTVPLAIPADHPAYAGHFPGRPILPGVVLLDATLAHLASLQGRHETIRIKSAKFLSPVEPGEALTLNYEATGSGNYRFEIVVEQRCAASGVVELALPDAGA
jgi:3-hydroxyacyl-[acyl-carrier-protein] dehydratase